MAVRPVKAKVFKSMAGTWRAFCPECGFIDRNLFLVGQREHLLVAVGHIRIWHR